MNAPTTQAAGLPQHRSSPLITLESIDDCPAWANARAFLQNQIVTRGAKRIADIGGGANPALDADFVRNTGLDYTVIDISQIELDKAPAYCRKIAADLAAPNAEFLGRVGAARFDLVFSSMLLEHVRDPLAAHQNIFSVLAPRGVAIHLYPSPNNLPLAINRLVPDGVGTLLLRLSQPKRDFTGHERKFPAYYKLCGNASRRLHNRFEELGYTVVQHTSYVGHRYYSRFPILREMERACRKPLIKAGISLTSAHLLILQKREPNTTA
jgi:SAM-dependent methyltransferase